MAQCASHGDGYQAQEPDQLARLQKEPDRGLADVAHEVPKAMVVVMPALARHPLAAALDLAEQRLDLGPHVLDATREPARLQRALGARQQPRTGGIQAFDLGEVDQRRPGGTGIEGAELAVELRGALDPPGATRPKHEGPLPKATLEPSVLSHRLSLYRAGKRRATRNAGCSLRRNPLECVGPIDGGKRGDAGHDGSQAAHPVGPGFSQARYPVLRHLDPAHAPGSLARAGPSARPSGETAPPPGAGPHRNAPLSCGSAPGLSLRPRLPHASQATSLSTRA